MRTADSPESIGRSVRLIRFLLLINFALLLILLGPGMSHKIDLELRSAGVEDLPGRLWQIWTIGSTLVASALFMIIGYKKRTAPEAARPRMILEGTLLLAWWATVLGFLIYGFVLGLGG